MQLPLPLLSRSIQPEGVYLSRIYI